MSFTALTYFSPPDEGFGELETVVEEEEEEEEEDFVVLKCRKMSSPPAPLLRS